jgi:hypothetical protein
MFQDAIKQSKLGFNQQNLDQNNQHGIWIISISLVCKRAMNHETSACHQLLLWVFKTQQQDPACLELRFTVCILRIYENTSHTYEIHEARLYRKIRKVYQTLSKVYRCVLNQYPIHISKKHTFPIILWLQSEPYGYGLFEHRLVTDPHLWSFLVGNHPFFGQQGWTIPSYQHLNMSKSNPTISNHI